MADSIYLKEGKCSTCAYIKRKKKSHSKAKAGYYLCRAVEKFLRNKIRDKRKANGITFSAGILLNRRSCPANLLAFQNIH